MKKTIFIAISVLAALSSCTKQMELYNSEAVAKNNAESIFGTIDPRQDWNMTVKGTVTVTANADLDDIAKVQILTASPFLNDEAKVLAEANVKKGGTVTLNYDAPNTYDKLVAACVSSNGVYYIQVFKVGQSKVSFINAAKSRTTRALASEAPTFTSITLAAPHKTFNAMRAEAGETCVIDGITYTEWSDGTWAGEQVWQPADGNTFDAGWKMDTEKNRGIIFRDIEGFEEGELENIKAITEAFLYKYSKDQYSVNGKRNNIRLIRESANFTTNNNYLITDGVNPVTLIPIQVYTTEFKKDHIYYYYFKPEDIPANMTEVNYIKQLPKYKAIQVERTTTTVASNAGEFFRNKEFLLPFYGDGTPTEGVNTASAIFPEGYKVGFMNMKHAENDWTIATNLNGCTYGDGRLNYAVNHIKGHYLTAMDKSIGGSTLEGMQFEDPRIAIFSANGKTYMCFEEGCDCNFCDMIIEVGSGTKIVNERPFVVGQDYTMCFEDRPGTADYDMNDVVIQGQYMDATHVQISIIACGAYDRLFLCGVNGNIIKDDKEVHSLFGFSTTEQFINTTSSDKSPIVDVITKSETETVKDVLKRIYVYNASTDKKIEYTEEAGKTPSVIIIPIDFPYPVEKQRINNAYEKFADWAGNKDSEIDWYNKPTEGKVFIRQ